jgi:hypothetical protein
MTMGFAIRSTSKNETDSNPMEVQKMTTKTQHNLLSFDRPVGQSKTWSLGWSTSSVRTGGNAQNTQSPGFYGALVPTGRR